LGGNGAGKTTLLTLLSKIKKPYRGKIIYSSSTKEKQTQLAYLPQEPLLVFVKDSLLEDFRFLMKINNLPEEKIYETIKKYDFFEDVPNFFDSNPLDLSGGEQQKMAILKLLLLNPEILLLDEPTKGLDAFLKMNLAKILNCLKEKGISIIMVTHDLEFAAMYSDRCSLMFAGELVSTDIL
jgi:energy-coupling factor transport system ATP-binding protein